MLRRAVCTLLMLGLAAPPAAAQLDADERLIRERLQARQQEMVAQLERWVALNTGTFNRPGLEAFAQLLVTPLLELGFEVERHSEWLDAYPGHGRVGVGPLIVARRPGPGPASQRFLVLGHYDTVFEPDSPFQSYRLDRDDPLRAIGPGVSDMKGGLVVLFFALRALAESGDLDRAQWTVLLNADEEIGSLSTRLRIEAEARKATLGFVFESARPGGEMVRSRRGLGQFYLTVDGVASHAGGAHSKGRSAILALARKVVEIEALTNYDAGITLNTGTFDGGTKRNIVPEFAEAWIDLRYDDSNQGDEIRERLEQIAAQPHVEGTHGALWGTLHRPPKRETDATRELLELHAEVARALGSELPPPIHAGGGTDGSLTGALGLPTLDSMGVRGGAAHTDREFVVLDSLSERAALGAILMRRLALRTQERGVLSPAFVPDGDRWAPAGGSLVNSARSGRKQR